MNPRKFKPLIDKFYVLIIIPTVLLLTAGTVVAAFEPTVLFIMIPTDMLTLYFLISPFFGFVELRESTLFIKFGFFLKKEIPYLKIRGVDKARKINSESMLSLKCAIEHINIKYNTFDMVTVSVKDNDGFYAALKERARITGQPSG